MAQNDSVDKIVQSYFAKMTRVPFEYKGVEYRPRTLRVSPGLLRGFTCPPMCGGCCPRFSLDYLPSEDKPYLLKPRWVDFNGTRVRIYSDLQLDNTSHKCRNLNWENGRCGIHGKQPFSCDFEIIRFFEATDDVKPHRVSTQLFGRGWAMSRVDGGRGALCELTDVTPETIAEVERKFSRLEEWMRHFGLKSKCDAVLRWVDANRDRPLSVVQPGFIE